jgi:HK97 gp10 family phage protein
MIKRLVPHSDKAISNALHEIGADNVKHLRGLIKAKDKTGTVYIVRGRRHIASAPGEPPASLSGRLSRTAGYIVRGTTQVEFGDKAPYGKFLEEGTVNMDPRPHVERTVNDKARDTRNSLIEHTQRTVLKK